MPLVISSDSTRTFALRAEQCNTEDSIVCPGQAVNRTRFGWGAVREDPLGHSALWTIPTQATLIPARMTPPCGPPHK